jgi:hypothetical protein
MLFFIMFSYVVLYMFSFCNKISFLVNDVFFFVLKLLSTW